MKLLTVVLISLFVGFAQAQQEQANPTATPTPGSTDKPASDVTGTIAKPPKTQNKAMKNLNKEIKKAKDKKDANPQTPPPVEAD